MKNIFDVDSFIELLQTIALGLVAICSVLFLISLAPYIFTPLAFVALIFLFKSDKPKKLKKINFMDEVKFKDHTHGFELPRSEMSKIVLKKVNKLIDKELKKVHLVRGYRTSEYTGKDINLLTATLLGNFIGKLFNFRDQPLEKFRSVDCGKLIVEQFDGNQHNERNLELTDEEINTFKSMINGQIKLGRSKRNVTPYLLSNQSKWDIFPINDFSIKTQEDMLKKLNVYNLEIRLLKE